MRLDERRANSDAEKAFTRFLEAKYNRARYSSYPKGVDGLYGLNLDRYAHVIDEDIEFETDEEIFRGVYGNGLPCSNDSDAIFVEGDSARLLRADELSSTESD